MSDVQLYSAIVEIDQQKMGLNEMMPDERGAGIDLMNDFLLITSPSGGPLKGKVTYIQSRRPGDSIYGIRIGDRTENLKNILKKHGFKSKKNFPAGFTKKVGFSIVRIAADDFYIYEISIRVPRYLLP